MGDYQLLGDPPGDNDYIPSPPNHVPEGWTIQSGGGISNMYHGYYQGPYSSRATRSDVYGESLPYPVIGNQETTVTNLYSYDSGANMRPRTEKEMGELFEPPYSNTAATADIDYPYGEQVLYGRENFTYELLDTPENQKEGFMGGGKSNKKFHPITVALLLIVLVITLDAWTNFTNSFISKNIFKNRKLNTKQYLFIAIVITIILVAISYFSGASITWFEKRETNN